MGSAPSPVTPKSSRWSSEWSAAASTLGQRTAGIPFSAGTLPVSPGGTESGSPARAFAAMPTSSA